MSSKAEKGHFEEESRGYFDFLAKVGLTKHLGSMEATRKLARLCHLKKGQSVLEIGCGVGATIPYLVKSQGCRVVGMDFVEGMVQQGWARARAQGIEGRVNFAVGDARKLPFTENLFDAVIMESLNVFFEDKGQALREYTRVTKPGGYVGFTEMTWLATPSPEVEEYYQRVVYAKALEADGWRELLVEAGLEDVTGNAYSVDLSQEAKGRIERYGCSGMLGILRRMLGLLFKDRETRAFLKDVSGAVPRDLAKDMGYGVFAGRKT